MNRQSGGQEEKPCNIRQSTMGLVHTLESKGYCRVKIREVGFPAVREKKTTLTRKGRGRAYSHETSTLVRSHT